MDRIPLSLSKHYNPILFLSCRHRPMRSPSRHGGGNPPPPHQGRTRRANYATQAPGAPTLQVFNRRTKYLQRERAASDVETSRKVDYLRDEVATRLCERLLDIKRHFPRVLDLGANACNIAKALTAEPAPDPDAPGPPGPSGPLSERLSELVAIDSSPTLLHRDASLPFNDAIRLRRQVIADEESLPFEANSFDAVLSASSLHWINDLPSVLSQVNHILKPDCPFLAAMFGGDTLYELRTSLHLAELDRRGGVNPTHMSPLADVRDVGGLLQRARFTLPTIDVDDIVVEYPSIFELLTDLQAMAENNAVLRREPGPLPRDVLLAADAIYRQLHGHPTTGALPATFRVIYLIGWKEGPGQNRPLPRGSGQVNLKDVLE